MDIVSLAIHVDLFVSNRLYNHHHHLTWNFMLSFNVEEEATD